MNDRTLTAQIVTLSPLHPGAGDAGLATELPVLRDAAGAPYIPGTQIAGRLRETATRLAPALGWPACTALDPPGKDERKTTCTCPVCDLFGSRGQKEKDGDAEPAASRLWCFDATIAEGSGRTLVRDGVGISRRTGAAAADAQALYDAEWIPAGTKFRLRLELEHRPGPTPSPDPEAVLALALSEWREGRGRLGGGAARGGGAFELKGPVFRRADLSSPEMLLAYLTADDPAARGDVVPEWLERTLKPLQERVKTRLDEGRAPAAGPHGSVGGVRGFAEIAFRLAFDGPVLVNDPALALAHGVHGVPVQADPDWSAPVLPGASLRGVLRAQVERIARTVAMRALAGETAAGGAAAAFARACPACDPFDTRRYASEERRRTLRACAAEQKEHAERAAAAGAAPAEVRETPESCPACALFGSIRRGSRLWIADAKIVEGKACYRLRDFVAIDRFTGGALDGAKFDALPLYSPAFDVRLLLWDAEGWELAALALALRDLHDGLATVGSGAAKGFGRAQVRDLAVRTGEAAPGLPALGEAPEVEEERASGIFRVRRWRGGVETLVAEVRARGWVRELADRCAKARREVSAGAVPWDAWYGAPGDGDAGLAELYPLTVDLAAREAAHAG